MSSSARARELGLADRVRFTGFLDTDALVDEYSRADVFVMPSRLGTREDGSPTGEGFGIVYIEAAACGCPSLALAHAGVPEAVEPGRSGVLVGTNEEVAGALLRLLRSPEECRALGRSARNWVQERYSIPAFDRRLDALLQAVPAAR